MDEVLLYDLTSTVIEKGVDKNYPFSKDGSDTKYFLFKEYIKAVFNNIGLKTYKESYIYDFSIIQIDMEKQDDCYYGKTIFESQERKIIFDEELIKIYKAFKGGDLYIDNGKDLFDINNGIKSFFEINQYVNKKDQYNISFVLCERENNKLSFYGYCLKDILKLRRLIGRSDYNHVNFTLYNEQPLLYYVFFKLALLWYKNDISYINERTASRVAQHILDEAVEMLYLNLKLPDLDCIKVISSLTYENTKCNSSLVFGDGIIDRSDINRTIKFKSPVIITIEDCRKIRKYLQMAQGAMHLIATTGWCSQIIGIVQNSEKIYNAEIRFKGHMKWELYIKGKKVVEYHDGLYKLTHLNNKEKEYRDRIKDFLDCGENDIRCDKLIEIICRAEEQDHGTLIIFTNKAKDIAKHYCECGRGIEIEPIDLFKIKETIYHLTAIDGALIVDETGICYGLGVILDGEARMYSNPGRGARYNSAYTFIANKIDFDSEDSMWLVENERYIAVVISEDKTVDIITNTDIMTPYIKSEMDLWYEMQNHDDGFD